MRLHQFHLRTLLYVLLACVFAGCVAGCAGPLDTATRQALNQALVGKRFLAEEYLGNRYNLEYTNNSVDGRSPTGVFIDPSLTVWYETDASFFESGSSGQSYTREQLQDIDRDLDFESFGQGIAPGQVVTITKVADKSDQLILEVETVTRYAVNNTYGGQASSRPRPRSARLHVLIGKERMADFKQTNVQPMVDLLLADPPVLQTEAQTREFIFAHYPTTPVSDLMLLTGLSKETIVQRYYRHLLAESSIPSDLQERLLKVLMFQQALKSPRLGLRFQDFAVRPEAIELQYALQDIAEARTYYSPELRAGLLFFDHILPLVKPVGEALDSESTPLRRVVVTCDYLFFDVQGRRFSEAMTYRLPLEDLILFTQGQISGQALADRSDILLEGRTPLRVSLTALDAVKHMPQPESGSWKQVQVELVDWEYEEHEDEGILTIEGEVKNTGTWIAEDVEVTTKGYNKYGIRIRSESTTLLGLLKPGCTSSFKIEMNAENVTRVKTVLSWDEVE